jgi:DNA-directed RNA polymerase subunit F
MRPDEYHSVAVTIKMRELSEVYEKWVKSNVSKKLEGSKVRGKKAENLVDEIIKITVPRFGPSMSERIARLKTIMPEDRGELKDALESRYEDNKRRNCTRLMVDRATKTLWKATREANASPKD